MTYKIKQKIALIILDGYGLNPSSEGNAVMAADTPYFDKLMADNPNTIVRTSGLDVGLPQGQMGNSEVGHTNIGAGRIVYQELTRISKDIEEGSFFELDALKGAIENSLRQKSALHLYGLLSDGGVHSHNTHLYALLEMAKKAGLTEVYVHCFYDGRDVPPESGYGYTEELLKVMDELGLGKIASLTGRYYVMDRDNRWERVQKAYDAMVLGQGVKADDPLQAIRDSYDAGVTDEFILPAVIEESGKPVATIKAGDSVVFYNFRPDRAREITRAFCDPDFQGFEREKGYFPLYYVCMTEYDKDFYNFENVRFAYLPESLDNTLGEIISNLGLKQLRMAETEKYAHVTFFLNGGREMVFEGEDRVLVPSPKVATYDLQPEMSAYQVADEAVARIESEAYDLIVLNFANCDMVGHSGIFDAAKKAVEAVDQSLAKVAKAALDKGYAIIVTADHGNAEQMIDPLDDGPFTAHTTNPVPLVLAGAVDKVQLKSGRLADLAPTILELMGIEKPSAMTGESLLR